MGEEYSKSIPIVRILTFGYFFNIVTGAASTLSAGMGKTELDRRYGIFTAVVNLAAVLGLSFLVGPLGVAWGTSLTLILGAFYFVQMFHTFLRVPLEEIMLLLWKPITAGICAALIVLFFTLLFPGGGTARMFSLIVLLIIASTYTVLYLSILSIFKVVSRDDLRMVSNMFQRKPLTI
jgi:O-antigen/teichoic acid export membrane protein